MIKISERDLEDIIFERMQTPEGMSDLHLRGLEQNFHDRGKVVRQFNFKEYGIADIVQISFNDRCVYIEITELKVTDFEISHLLQLGRYISAAYKIASRLNIKRKKIFITGVLIVAGFNENSDYTWLDKIVDKDIRVYSTLYSIDGLRFEQLFNRGWGFNDSDASIDRFISVKEYTPLIRSSINDSMLEDASVREFYNSQFNTF